VYLVKEGEFEVLKYINLIEKSKKELSMDFSNSKMKFQLVKIAQLGSGKIFGEIDAVSSLPYSITVKCQSTTGIWLKIKTEDFLNIITEVNAETLK